MKKELNKISVDTMLAVTKLAADIDLISTASVPLCDYINLRNAIVPNDNIVYLELGEKGYDFSLGSFEYMENHYSFRKMSRILEEFQDFKRQEIMEAVIDINKFKSIDDTKFYMERYNASLIELSIEMYFFSNFIIWIFTL